MPPYLAHRYCLLLDERLIWLHLVSNLLIWLAYMVIPLCLAFIVGALLTNSQVRRDLVQSLSAVMNSPETLLRALQCASFYLGLFALFIFLCGCTHALDALVLYRAMYWQQGILLLLTGLVSAWTAGALVFAVAKVATYGRRQSGSG